MLLELDIKGFVNLQKLQRWQLMFSYNQKMFVLQSYQKKMDLMTVALWLRW